MIWNLYTLNTVFVLMLVSVIEREERNEKILTSFILFSWRQTSVLQWNCGSWWQLVRVLETLFDVYACETLLPAEEENIRDAFHVSIRYHQKAYLLASTHLCGTQFHNLFSARSGWWVNGQFMKHHHVEEEFS